MFVNEAVDNRQTRKFTKSGITRVFVVDVIVLPRTGLLATNFMEKVKVLVHGSVVNDVFC